MQTNGPLAMTIFLSEKRLATTVPIRLMRTRWMIMLRFRQLRLRQISRTQGPLVRVSLEAAVGQPGFLFFQAGRMMTKMTRMINDLD